MSAKNRMISVIAILTMVVGMCTTAFTGKSAPDRTDAAASAAESAPDRTDAAASAAESWTDDMYAAASAAKPIPDIAGITREDYMKEVKDTIKDYIEICKIDASNLSIAQPIPIIGSNDENNRAVFLFHDMECIGLMMFSYVNHSYASSFTQGNYVEITNALNKNQRIALVSFEWCMVMLANDGWELVSGNDDFVREAELDKVRANCKRQAISLTPLVFSDEETQYETENDTVDRSWSRI